MSAALMALMLLMAMAFVLAIAFDDVRARLTSAAVFLCLLLVVLEVAE